MNKTITKLVGGVLFALLFVAATPMYAIDIALNMANGSWITDDVKTAASGSGIYLKVDGTTVTTHAEESGSTFHFKANKYNDAQHGWVWGVITITIDCPVKIGIGNCQYNTKFNGSVSDGEHITNFTTASNCYHTDTENNVTYVYFKESGSKTLTITCPSYLPFFSIKTVDPAEIPGERTVSFDKGEGEGVAPASRNADAGSIITLPKNRTLFVEGKTLTGWSDGVNTYATNSSYTVPNENVTLTAQYTPNTVTLSDRNAEVTITYDLSGNNENNSYTVAKDATGFMVTQATVNGSVIDVKATVAAKGKDFKSNGSGWHYIGADTEVTVRSGLGATFSVYQYNTSSMTLDGNNFTIPGTNQNATYTATTTATTAVIKQGNADYWRTLAITLPAPQSVDVTVSSALYATYYNGVLPLMLPDGLQAATVDGETGGTLTFNYRYDAGDVIPAGTPVLLKAASATTYTLTEKIGDATAAPTGNYLYGSDEAVTTTGGGTGAKYYALQYGAGDKASVLGFYWVNTDGAAFTSGAHKAWLALPAAASASYLSLDADDMTTGIEHLAPALSSGEGAQSVFNLNGQRVSQPRKGLYLVNGKKVIINK